MIALGVLAGVQTGCGLGVRTPAVPSPSDSLFAKTRLESAIGEYWKMVLPRTPALVAEIAGTADYLPQESTLDSRWQLQVARRMRSYLTNVDAEALSSRDYATLETLERRLDEMAAAPGFDHLDLSVMTVGSGPMSDALMLLAEHPLGTAGEAARYSFLVEDLGFWFLRVRTGLEEKWRRGILPASPVASRFRETLVKLRGGDLANLLSLGGRAERLSEEVRDSLKVDLDRIFATRVHPALDSLIAFTQGPWTRATPAAGGLWRVPGGKEYYRFLLRKHTGLDVDPEAAHGAGLAQLRRFDSTLAVMRTANGWNPNPRQLHDSIRRSIVALPFSPEAVSARVNGVLASLADRGSQRFPPRDSTRVRSRLASWREELTDAHDGATNSDSVTLPITRAWLSPSSLFGITSRSARLGWPGRALQRLTLSSSDSLPDFIALHPSAAGLAAWSEYAAAAAGEIGAYERPEDAYAHVMRQAFNAALLIVDTGIHYFGWTSPQAMETLAPWSIEDAASLQRVLVEQVLSNPARAGVEALALREMTAMRGWMERELGAAFDVRRWHGEVLSLGPVPLPVLAHYLEWWAWKEQRASLPPPTP
ncbi:MAG: DUF885 family protein [Gemmatimonadota bacterium]